MFLLEVILSETLWPNGIACEPDSTGETGNRREIFKVGMFLDCAEGEEAPPGSGVRVCDVTCIGTGSALIDAPFQLLKSFLAGRHTGYLRLNNRSRRKR